MSEMQKPDFSTGVGAWIDPNFIPADTRRELLLHLKKSPLTGEQQSSLLTFANDMAQMVMDGELLPAQTQRAQIERIASDARRLLASLNALSSQAKQTLHAHTDYLAYGSTPPVELEDAIKEAIRQPEGSLMASTWDWVAALEQSAEYAAQQFEPDTTSKPSQMRARGYVTMLAGHVRGLTGQLPPKDSASWFSCFAVALGEALSLSIGPRIVASGISAIR